MTSDNVSPMNLIYIRKVGYGVRRTEDIFKTNALESSCESSIESSKACESNDVEFLQNILYKVINNLK